MTDEGRSSDEPVESGGLEDDDGGETGSDETLQEEQEGKGYGAG